jgi:C-terminal processing protease CtpA/Prc
VREARGYVEPTTPRRQVRTPLGVEGAVPKIRGAGGTTVTITLRRGDQIVQLVVQRRKLHA